jgi:hypothetical protein
VVAHEAPGERFVDGVLADRGRAELVLRAGLELDVTVATRATGSTRISFVTMRESR